MTEFSNLVAAADIGGTHITAAIVNVADRSLVQGSLVRLSVDASDNANNIIENWASALKQATENISLNKIAIAMPGPFDYDKGISYMNNQGKYESLYELNVKQLLADALSVNPDRITFANDAACFLSGEVFASNVNTVAAQRSVSVTLGTGLGTACYKNSVAQSADLWCLPFKDHVAEYYLSS